MNSRDAKLLARRLSIHLCHNEFGLCHEILNSAEEEWEKTRGKDNTPTAIAELNIELRLVELLDREGYIYISDLDGIDIGNLRLPQLGPVLRQSLIKALQELRPHKSVQQGLGRREKRQSGIKQIPFKRPTSTNVSE